MCIHGKCREGQSTCDGNCDKGWIGDDCEIPFEEDKRKFIKKGRYKYTLKDGAYKPKKNSNSRMSRKATSKESEIKQSGNDQSSTKAKKI